MVVVVIPSHHSKNSFMTWIAVNHHHICLSITDLLRTTNRTILSLPRIEKFKEMHALPPIYTLMNIDFLSWAWI